MGEKSVVRQFWEAAFAAVVALALAVSLAGCAQQAASASSADSESAASSVAGASASASASSTSGETEDIAEAVDVQLVVDGTQADKGVIADAMLALMPGATVYDALLASGLDIEVDQSSGSVFVTGIGGLGPDAGDENSAWLFEVNGEMAEVGADQYVLKNGDVITWTWWLNAMNAFALDAAA